MQSKNGFTGTIGSWSARNPWKAIAAWVAFVLAAVVIGGAVGTKELKPSESGAGDSGTAARILDKAGFGTNPTEQVIVSSSKLTAADPQFRAVVADVISRLQGAKNVDGDPVAVRASRRSPPTATARSSSFEVPGTQQTAGEHVTPALADHRGGRRGAPRLHHRRGRRGVVRRRPTTRRRARTSSAPRRCRCR